MFHSLRHCSASLKLQIGGGNIKAVQGDTGHAQSRMVTDLYAHTHMMLVGAFCKKSKIIDENGKKCLTSLCMDVIIPCNIIKPCIGSTDPDTLKTCSLLLLSGILIMLISIVGNRFIYRRSAVERRKIMQY